MDPSLPPRGRGRLPPTMPTNTSVPNPTNTLINGTTTGPWRPRSELDNAPRELRRPRDPPKGLPTNTPVSDKENVDVSESSNVVEEVPKVADETPTASVLRPSKLSAEAKEFVPRFRTTIPAPQGVKEFVPRSRSSVGSPQNVKEFVPRNRTPVDDLAGINKQYRHQHHSSNEGWRNDAWGGGSDDDVEITPEEVALNHLSEVMAHLTVNPGSYDTMARPLVDAFGAWLNDEGTALVAVAALFDQAITDANFRFNGARLCHQLSNRFGSTMRSLLLNRCHMEHTHTLETMAQDPRRAHGYLMFTADLYVTLEVVKGSRQKIAILGKAVLETMTRMLATSGSHDNVKCVCQALKLAGIHLNELDKEQVDSVFSRLHKIHIDRATAANTQLLVLNVTNLRRDNWGVSTQAATSVATTAANAPLPPSGPTFYGPDGLVLTQEESQFLQENVTSSTEPDDSDPYRDSYWEQDDGMNEEVEAAFEQFLLIGKKDTPH